MGHAAEDVLRQRVCRWKECRCLFWICRSCDRGHQYCCDECRKKARREQNSESNRRYRQTIEAKLDQRDRQRAYRQRQSAFSVMDQGSPSAPSTDIITPPVIDSPVVAENGGKHINETVETHDSGLPYCIICGRTSRFVDPYQMRRKYP
jgi:hypothetical protein